MSFLFAIFVDLPAQSYYVWKVSSDFDLIWLSWQINKDSKQKGHESSIGEILDTLQKH